MRLAGFKECHQSPTLLNRFPHRRTFTCTLPTWEPSEIWTTWSGWVKHRNAPGCRLSSQITTRSSVRYILRQLRRLCPPVRRSGVPQQLRWLRVSTSLGQVFFPVTLHSEWSFSAVSSRLDSVVTWHLIPSSIKLFYTMTKTVVAIRSRLAKKKLPQLSILWITTWSPIHDTLYHAKTVCKT